MAFAEGIIPRLKESAEKGKVKGYAAKIKSRFGRGDSAHSPQEAPKKEKFSTPEFKRNFFVDRGNTTSAEVKGRRRETKEQSEWVQFSENTRNEFTSFLDNYATNMHDVMDQPGGADILKAQPHSEQMYKMLSEGVDFDGTSADDVKLKANIKKMLEKPSGWVLTKELIEQETALGLMALGLVTSAKTEDTDHVSKVGRLFGKTKDDGTRDPHAFVNRTPWDKNRKLIDSTIGAGTGGIIGNLLARGGGEFWGNVGDAFSNIPHGGVAMATYAGIGLGVLAGNARAEYRQGQKLPGTNGEFAQNNTRLLEDIKRNTALSNYIKSMWGVDVNDYRMVGTELRVRFDRSSANIRDVVKACASNLKTREHYFDDLGIPKDARDMMPERRIMDTGNVSRSGERITQKIAAKYKEIGGSAARPAKDNMDLYRQAREKVLTEMTQELIEGVKDEPRRTLSSIDKKIESRQPGGEKYEEKKAELNSPQRKQGIETDKALLEAQREIPVLAKSISADKSKAEAEADTYITDTFNSITDIKGAQDAIRATLLHDQPISLKGEPLIVPIIIQRRKVDEDWYAEYQNNILTRNRGRSRNGRGDLLDTSGQVELTREQESEETELLKQQNENKRAQKMAEIAQIETRLIEIQRVIEGHTMKVDDYKQAEKEVDDKKPKYKDDYTSFISHPKFKLRVDVLQNGDIEDLLKKINVTHTLALRAGEEFGWSENENNNPENRRKLLNAIIEAKAQMRISAGGATDNEELRQEELKKLLGERNRDLITMPSSDVESNKDFMEERNKLEITRDALAPTSQDRILGSARNVSLNLNTYFPIKEIVPRPALGMPTHEPVLLKDLIDKGDVSFTPEEDKAINEPVAYFQLLDILFDYQKREDREGYFKKLYESLPPTELFNYMKKTADNAGITGGNFPELVRGINENKVTPIQLRSIFKSVLDNLEKFAMSVE